MTAAAAPPAERPATKTRFGSTEYSCMTRRVMPAISEGSPSSRRWSAARNQFQHLDGLAPLGCAGYVHFVVLHFLPVLRPTGWPSADMAVMYAAVVLVTVGLSSLTYLMIEKPMIRLGSALIVARQSLNRRRLDLQPKGNVAN